MNISNTHRHVRLVLPFLVGASILLGACGGGNDTADIQTVDTVDTVDTVGTVESVVDASGTEPASACGLLDTKTVDAVLGTSGVTSSLDTRLGLYDGCRWATATTDVPALLIGYADTMEFDTIRHLACDGTTPEPAAAAGPDAVACFGVVVAPAGTGVLLVDIDDPMDQWDDAGELDLATQFAASALAR